MKKLFECLLNMEKLFTDYLQMKKKEEKKNEQFAHLQALHKKSPQKDINGTKELYVASFCMSSRL